MTNIPFSLLGLFIVLGTILVAGSTAQRELVLKGFLWVCLLPN